MNGYDFFDDVALDEFVPETTITRSTYGLRGRPIAIQVEGNPDNGGLYFIHTDRLGSVKTMSEEFGDLGRGDCLL